VAINCNTLRHFFKAIYVQNGDWRYANYSEKNLLGLAGGGCIPSLPLGSATANANSSASQFSVLIMLPKIFDVTCCDYENSGPNCLYNEKANLCKKRCLGRPLIATTIME